MRHLVFAFLLVFAVSVFAWAQSATDADTQRNAAEIRAAANKLIASGSPDDVAKGAALLEKAAALEHDAANADKLALERQKLKQELDESQHNHRWSEILVSYIPLATTIILAGTLIFQITQASIERREKREERATEAKDKEQQRITDAEERAAESARKEMERYTNALKEIQSSEKVSTAGTLINTFMDGPYRSNILDKTVTLLLRRDSMEDFQSLFMEVMNPLTYDMLPQMRKLYTSVDTSFFTIATPIWDESTFSRDLTKLSDKDRKLYDLYDQEQLFLSNKLAELLRTPAPPGMQVDLSQLNFRNMDLSGVDLESANIAASNWNYVNLDGCDMGRVTSFDNCSMYSTAWWHAARISKPLLDWLSKNYPYSAKQTYGGKLPAGPEEYETCVAKLAAGGSETGGSRPWGSRGTASAV